MAISYFFVVVANLQYLDLFFSNSFSIGSVLLSSPYYYIQRNLFYLKQTVVHVFVGEHAQAAQ